jgi:acid phosphatase (class A)
MRKTLIVVLAALVLAACATPRSRGRAGKVSYMPDVHGQSLPLGAAPAPGSPTDIQDLLIVKDWQSKRTPQDCARAGSEAEPGYEAFFGGISPFPRPLPEEASAFFDRVRAETFRVVGELKRVYNRPRPYARDSALHPCIPTPKEDGYSYPSGHSTLGRVLALTLSALVPARRAEFMSRGDQVALDRVIGGVHHPSDIAAGKQFGDEIYAELSKSPAFRADLEKMRRLLQP